MGRFSAEDRLARERRGPYSAEQLRRHFARHNRWVLLLGILSLLAAAALWYVLYAVLFWLAFLFVAIDRGVDAQPPQIFPALFIYSAGSLLLLSWWARLRSPNEAPRDEKSGWEIALEFLLAAPRITLAVWGNFSAWQRLSDEEIELAAAFLERLERDRRIPIHQAPLDLPEPVARERILLALQLTNLLHVYHRDGVAWLCRQSSGPKHE